MMKSLILAKKIKLAHGEKNPGAKTRSEA